MDSYEKKRWIELACSEQESSRKLAFDLAASMKDEIQNELMIWINLVQCIELKSNLFQLLNKESKKTLKSMCQEVLPPPLSTLEEYSMLNYTDDPHLKAVMVEFLIEVSRSNDMRPFYEQPLTIRFVKGYKDKTGCSLRYARDIVVDFRDQYIEDMENSKKNQQ